MVPNCVEWRGDRRGDIIKLLIVAWRKGVAD